MTMLTTIVAYLFLSLPAAKEVVPELPVPYCDASGAKARDYTKGERRETRERVQAVCKDAGASAAVCSYLDAIVVRESSGRFGVRHTIGSPEHGITENGLGAMGLSLRWHADKWPGDDEDPMFCVPEVSALVALDIVHRAVNKWKAATLVEVQAVYGGQFGCAKRWQPVGPWERIYNRLATVAAALDLALPVFRPTLVRECGLQVTPRTYLVCGRLERYDIDCRASISAEDIGTLPPMDERRELAARLHAEYTSKEQEDEDQ